MNAAAIRHNLDLFRSLKGRTNVKLNYNRVTGQFQAETVRFINLGRAWDNLGKSDSEKQSVASEENFAGPIREVFAESILQRVETPASRAEALDGLRALRTIYSKEYVKLAMLNLLLAEIDNMLRGTLRDEMFAKWRAADPAVVFNADDLVFLRTLYNDAAIMTLPVDDPRNEASRRRKENLPTDLKDRIYNKYNEAHDAPITNQHHWAAALPTNCRRKLQKRRHIYEPGDPHGRFDTFMHYFPAHGGLRSGQLWRTYVNCKDTHAADILTALTERAGTFGIKSFKVAEPGKYHLRSDKIVVYVRTRANAAALAENLARTFGADAFHNSIPAFVQPQARGIGIGVEPEHVELGFTPPKEKEQHSYGTIRAKLLALAVLHYHAADPKLHPKDEAAFLKWAALAFSGYRLDLEPVP